VERRRQRQMCIRDRTWTVSTPHLVALVKLAIEHEREACEALCKWRTGIQQVDAAIDTCAAAIRARGQA
jgi:hypothetical protein